MKIKITTVEKPSAALSTLRTHQSFDLVVTDLHMPEMDGIQLKKQIDREFKLPVVVMSADTNKNAIERSLACGAVEFMKKPIKPDDLKSIWKHAMATKKTNSAIPMKTIQFHDDDINNNNNNNDNDNGNSSSSSSTVNTGNQVQKSKNGNDNGSRRTRKYRKRKSPTKDSDEDDDENDVSRRAPKRSKVVWTNSLHNLFLQAIRHIGLDKAVPKKILEFMNVPGLTRENVASHLQKYRIFLKKVAERGVISSALLSNRALASNFGFGHFNPSRRSFGSSKLGFGQSKLLNTSLPRRQSIFDNQTQPTRPSYGLGRLNSYGTSLLSHKAANFGFQTPQESQRSNLFNQSGLVSGNPESGFCSSGVFDGFGTTKNYYNSCLNNPTSNYSTNYAGIRINGNGEISGIGSTRINGDGRGSGTAAPDGNLSQELNYLSAQAGFSSNPSVLHPISNDFGPKNDYSMDDLAAIVGDDVFSCSDFDELNLANLDCLPYEPSNLHFNFNQNQNDETVLNYVPKDISNAPNMEMNRLVDAVPNELNLSADQEVHNEVWSEDEFMKALFEDGVL